MLIRRSGSLRGKIEEEARRLGFHLVGVTSSDPPPHVEAYQRWLSASRHGDMAYLAANRARQCRADPRLILPGSRAILVLGIRYPSPSIPATSSLIPAPSSSTPAPSSSTIAPPSLIPAPSSSIPAPSSGQAFSLISAPSSAQTSKSPPTGRVASYAWGADYHEELAVRLRTLAAFIENQCSASLPNRWYTDAGPILERDLAQRAGLGWIGKNTCLIHPRQGSYFFLAEILLGVDMEPDEPFTADYCGTCTRCMDACPTACILPDRSMDSRRCISYLTIELKSAIPLELRHSIGDWIFGCDLCQMVCPWNRRFSPSDGDPAFDPRPGVPGPVLLQELALTPQAFQQKFKDSPIRRLKRRGYLRNVAIALGNCADPATVPGLAHALRDESEPLVRGHDAWALGCIGNRSARSALTDAARRENDPYVLKEIRAALERSTGKPT